MSTEAWLAKLEEESRALKASFERSANSLLLKTQNIAYQTIRNQVTVSYPGGSYVQDDAERVILTLNTASGINTIAKLELSVDNVYARPYVRRLPYAGGARWSITCAPKSPYSPTNITFVVRSMTEGTLSVAEVSS